MSRVNLHNLKVSMPSYYRNAFTLDDIDRCKATLSNILSGFDGGKLDLSSEVVSALSLVSGVNAEASGIYDVNVTYAKNGRLEYDYHGDGTGIMDLWIECKGLVEYSGFYIFGVYLSDIWALNSDNRDDIRSHMWIREFHEK